MKTDEQEVINFLLTTEIIPLCLRIMESGSELSKTVCVFILIRFYIVLTVGLLHVYLFLPPFRFLKLPVNVFFSFE